MSTLSYEIVDVFTDRPFTGNPLAVVFGGDDLGRDQMQALAREFHLSETVFVLTPTVDGATYRARIFTPEEELPFAGHPSVGAAVTQMRRGLFGPELVFQECGAGVLPIDVEEVGRATLTGGQPTYGPALDPDPLLLAVGLSFADYAGPGPRIAGCGLDFAYLSVHPDAVARARIAAGAGGGGDVCVFSWDPATFASHARVFAPDKGVPEDPATGSAALGFGVWLVASGLLPFDGESSYVVRQGAELHRPSTLECAVTAVAGVAVRVTVTGSVVPVARGEIAVPPFVG
jgi:trans-2,3-dihydro-3-hydroxyanthranilate isomerase